jgi:hypothetical protein
VIERLNAHEAEPLDDQIDPPQPVLISAQEVLTVKPAESPIRVAPSRAA